MRGVVYGPGGAEDVWELNILRTDVAEIEDAIKAALGGFITVHSADNGLKDICDVVVYEIVTQVRQEYRLISPALDDEKFQDLFGFPKPPSA